MSTGPAELHHADDGEPLDYIANSLPFWPVFEMQLRGSQKNNSPSITLTWSSIVLLSLAFVMMETLICMQAKAC